MVPICSLKLLNVFFLASAIAIFYSLTLINEWVGYEVEAHARLQIVL